MIGPQVLTLQLVWDQQVSSQEIRETLGHMEEDLDITAMYDDMQVCRRRRYTGGNKKVGRQELKLF